jgi:hypothetical protein
LGNATSFKYTTADFNQLAILQGLKPSAVGQLEIRVKSSISESVADLYSNTLTVSVTPYIVVINYPSLWVAGDFQGWNPATAQKFHQEIRMVFMKATFGFREVLANLN